MIATVRWAGRLAVLVWALLALVIAGGLLAGPVSLPGTNVAVAVVTAAVAWLLALRSRLVANAYRVLREPAALLPLLRFDLAIFAIAGIAGGLLLAAASYRVMVEGMTVFG